MRITHLPLVLDVNPEFILVDNVYFFMCIFRLIVYAYMDIRKDWMLMNSLPTYV